MGKGNRDLGTRESVTGVSGQWLVGRDAEKCAFYWDSILVKVDERLRFDGLQGYETGRQGRWGERVALQRDERERIV